MKKTILSFLAILLLLSGCNKKNESDKIKVSVSFYPLSYFAQEIGKQHIEVFNVLDKGSDAHDYEPSIQDRIRIEDSELFIHNGFDLEHWVDKTLASIKNDNLLIVDSSTGIDPILRNGHADPHIWLDPFLAQTQIENIYHALVAVDPIHQKDYESNMLLLKEKLTTLQNEFAALSQLKNQTLVLEHEIFSYLSYRYGFNQVGVSGILPEGEPSFQQLNEVIEYIKNNDIDVILLSKHDSKKVIDTIAKETSTRVLLIDSMEIGDDDFDYFSIMQTNLNALLEALNHE